MVDRVTRRVESSRRWSHRADHARKSNERQSPSRVLRDFFRRRHTCTARACTHRTSLPAPPTWRSLTISVRVKYVTRHRRKLRTSSHNYRCWMGLNGGGGLIHQKGSGYLVFPPSFSVLSFSLPLDKRMAHRANDKVSPRVWWAFVSLRAYVSRLQLFRLFSTRVNGPAGRLNYTLHGSLSCARAQVLVKKIKKGAVRRIADSSASVKLPLSIRLNYHERELEREVSLAPSPTSAASSLITRTSRDGHLARRARREYNSRLVNYLINIA